MDDEYDDNIVDLNAFREQREREQAEKERLEKEQQDEDEIEYMRSVLSNIMGQLGHPPEITGSMFYVPMTDDDYFSQYHFNSGYTEEGDWYSSWEAEGFNEEDYIQEPEEED